MAVDYANKYMIFKETSRFRDHKWRFPKFRVISSIWEEWNQFVVKDVVQAQATRQKRQFPKTKKRLLTEQKCSKWMPLVPNFFTRTKDHPNTTQITWWGRCCTVTVPTSSFRQLCRQRPSRTFETWHPKSFRSREVLVAATTWAANNKRRCSSSWEALSPKGRKILKKCWIRFWIVILLRAREIVLRSIISTRGQIVSLTA